jgi:Tfp pilus assembly protein PilV
MCFDFRSPGFWRLGLDRLRSQSGMSIAEAMVAMTLLLVGLLGTIALVDTASSSAGSARSREGATNLARELLEDAHSTAYANVGASGWITTAMQGLNGGSGSVSSPSSASSRTTVSRRGVSYTATVDWCSVDDSKDSYGTHSSSVSWCSDSATTGTSDSAPQDLKRVTATIDYSVNGQAQTLKQTVTFSATGGMVAPSVQSLVPSSTPPGPTAPFVVSTAGTTDVTFLGTAAGAADMKFSVNGIEVTSGVTNNNNGSWSFDWPIASLTDGTYTIGATAVDALGNRSAPMTIQVRLARGAPLNPQNVAGGYNYVNPTGVGNGGSLVVELQWDANPEGSVTGYEVLKGATSVCGGQTSTANSCIDASPASSGSTTYTVKTWYRDASDTMQSASTSYAVTAPGIGTLPSTWGVVTSQANAWAATGCDGPSGERDLVSNYPTSGGTTATYNGVYFLPCIAKFTSTISMSAGTISGQMWFANTSNKTCSTSNLQVYLEWTNANGSSGGIAGGPYLPSPSSVPGPSAVSRYTWSGSVAARAFTAGQQLYLVENVAHTSPSCLGMVVYYNSGTYQTTVTFPTLSGGGSTLATPNPPTGLSVTVNADGTRTLNWTAPAAGTAVDFYRIYRDGTATSARLDSEGAAVTPVSWTDTTAGGSSHTYRVTAVSAALAESAFAGPASG